MKDYYEILGISHQATQQEIKERFRFLSHAYHPDKFSSSSQRKQAEEMFKLKNEAYQVLSVLESRTIYDEERALENLHKEERESTIEVSKGFQKKYLIGGIAFGLIIAGVVFTQLGIKQKGPKNSTPGTMSTLPYSVTGSKKGFPGIQPVLNITRDAFDSESEFQKRQREAVDVFNNAVKQHNTDYQAATATLSMGWFDGKSGILPLSIDWNVWTNKLDREGIVTVSGNQAKALFREGKQKPIYMYLDIVEDRIRISKIAMIGLGEEMVVSFLPSRTVKHDPISGMDFVWIPGRSFTMGCTSTNEDCQDSEKAAHEVYVNGFWMGRYEVTEAQWKRIMGSDDSNTSDSQIEELFALQILERDNGNHPIMTFSEEFINRLNKKAKRDIYRLPSEAEWEYAARAGSGGIYSFGDDPRRLSEYAWYSRNSGGNVHPVGQLKPNKWGLYDMHGNVWELCQDFWHPNYENAPLDGKVWSGGDRTYRVVRGGGVEDPANFLRCAARSVSDCDSDSQFHRLGFRLVRSCGFFD